MIKKNPSYRLTVYTQVDTTIIQYPLTCKFTSQRNAFSKSNKCSIQVYNLAPETRAKIRTDKITLDESTWKYVKLEAGWNGVLSQVFMGKILQAYSSKEGGSTDVITYIECQPFDLFSSQTSVTFEAGTTYKDAYLRIAQDLENVEIGNIGTLEGAFKTQTTFDGNTFDQLNILTGGNTFIDNGVLNTLMSNEVIDVPVPLVTDDNGLLSVPQRRDCSLEIKMLFEPSLIVGQLLEIQSNIEPAYNGQYKVIGFNHDCMISPTQAGQRITTVELWIAPLLASTDINITGKDGANEEEGSPTEGAAPVQGTYYKVKGQDVTPAVGTVQAKWIMPCKGPITSPYGWRKSTNSFHSGIDIYVPVGTPIKSIADGTVILAQGNIRGYGNAVYINHGTINGKKIVAEYGHVSQIIAKKDMKVKQGQVIALSGGAKGAPGSGWSKGPHLHLTIRENGQHVNPFKYIIR